MGPVAKQIACDCGYVVVGDTDDVLVADAQQHARAVHGIELTREQVLAMAHPIVKEGGRT